MPLRTAVRRDLGWVRLIRPPHISNIGRAHLSERRQDIVSAACLSIDKIAEPLSRISGGFW